MRAILGEPGLISADSPAWEQALQCCCIFLITCTLRGAGWHSPQGRAQGLCWPEIPTTGKWQIHPSIRPRKVPGTAQPQRDKWALDNCPPCAAPRSSVPELPKNQFPTQQDKAATPQGRDNCPPCAVPRLKAPTSPSSIYSSQREGDKTPIPAKLLRSGRAVPLYPAGPWKGGMEKALCDHLPQI